MLATASGQRHLDNDELSSEKSGGEKDEGHSSDEESHSSKAKPSNEEEPSNRETFFQQENSANTTANFDNSLKLWSLIE